MDLVILCLSLALSLFLSLPLPLSHQCAFLLDRKVHCGVHCSLLILKDQLKTQGI